MASDWIKFVKSVHSKSGGSYSAAMKKASVLWKKRKKSGKSGKSDPEEKKGGRI